MDNHVLIDVADGFITAIATVALIISAALMAVGYLIGRFLI